ncbi:hypothetical protein GCM10007938_16080 [Vibrio zhanjiangensis]|uniref:EscD/YscD/HrpQ family type III secretion system inner membrane ring protein n=1 Tax=Vibrio zhanjiangensis TaxID=1046128 RepID=A0ABQ6EXB4_9VIBR|nr:type III secretion system inner membrane ring subunit SctD [Vibrio zhanjiangensis]GLT17830.1 hypothetical protein GCM10007938_16080 [Vibrio zhanjiangensis]
MTWTLKVLSGKHSGAEMVLDKKHIIIGSCHEGADCVLTDIGLADTAMQITVNDKIIALKELNNAKWYINGKVQRTSLSSIAPYDVVQIGAIAFTVGKVDATWPTINLPQQPRFRFPWTGVLFSGLLCIGSLNASFYSSNNSIKNNTIDIRPALEQSSTSPTDSKNFGLIVSEQDKRTFVTGYIQDRSTSNTARRQIEANSEFPLIWKVHRIDKLTTSIQTLLNEHNLYGYDVSVDLEGRATIKGVVSDQLSTATLATSIKKEIPGLSKVTFNTTKASEVILWLNQSIDKMGLYTTGASNYQKHILISGKTNTLQKAQIHQLIDSANSKFGNQVPIQYQPFIDPEGMLPPIRAVSTSFTPYLELSNGQKYLKNSIIGDGFTIKEITEDGISLLKDKQIIWIGAAG